jgi:hypothetical protein
MIKFLEGKDEDGLGIPYPSAVHSDGTNAGYFDLKRDPAAFEQVYELEGWPEFESLLRTLNKGDSFFRTLRFDVWFAAVTGHPRFKRLAVGYVTIAFEILEFNTSKGCFEEMRKRFTKFAPQCVRWPETSINFRHVPTSYNDHHIDRGWSEDIEIHGFGANETEARNALMKGLPPVERFFSKESSMYFAELKKGRKTIS